MSEPRYISPMLDGFSLGQSISEHSGVECYPAMRDDSDKRYIVKKISLPASQVQVEALLLTGVFRDAEAVRAYYEELAQGVHREVLILDTLAGQRGFVPYKDHQIVPMETGVGYEVILLSRYRKTLERWISRNPMTHLSAINLGIDMCAALAVCREAGWLFVDLKPENIYLFNDQEYRIGDLGFVPMDMLAYTSLPDRYRSIYTAPEVPDAYSSLNATMDTYALGLVLYQVYNEGKLPFTTLEERAAWLEKLTAGEVMAAPVCADEEMTAIITKACAPDPADRWQTPAEMGHALISYMQRNGADDIPLIPIVPPEAEEPAGLESDGISEQAETVEETVEETPVEDSAEAPVVEEMCSGESAADSVAEEDSSAVPAETSPVEEPPVDAPAEEIILEEPTEEVPAVESEAENPDAAQDSDAADVDWIDLMDAFLAEEEDGSAPAPENEEPSLRQLLGDEQGYLSDAENITEGEVSAEITEMLNAANELIEHQAPAPVIIPEPIDLPIPEPIHVEGAKEENLSEEDSETTEILETTEAAEVPVIDGENAKPSLWKKLLRTVAALAAAAGLAFGIWYYYQNYYLQPIEGMTFEGSAREVTVMVDTPMDQSKLTVICKDTYGNAVKGTLENGTVTFTDLIPGSQYIITLEPNGFCKLTGSTSITYSTPAETQITHLTAVTGQEAGSAIISFGIEGSDSTEWTLTYTAEGVEPQSVTFTGHTVTLTELTVGTAYTFTLTAPEEVLLVGENVITHTASDLIQASNLALSDYADGVISVSWTAPEGVEKWIVRCFDGAGYDQLQEVNGNSASFEGVTEGSKYTVEVIAASMTLGVRTEITADQNHISGFAAILNGSTIELSWNYDGAIPEGGWKILWSADGGSEQILTAEENKATLAPAAPGSSYTFTIQPPEDSNLQATSAALQIPAAGNFSAHKLDSKTIIVQMYDVPAKAGWNYSTLHRAKEVKTFKPASSLALLYTVTKPYTFDNSQHETIFVIRDTDGKLISTASRSRVWDKMWDNGYCTETVTNLPSLPGQYILTIYIENGKLAELPFTIK